MENISKIISKILSFDIGKNTAFCFLDKCGFNTGTIKYNNLLEFGNEINKCIKKWKPEIVVIPYPTRFYKVIMAHAKLMGVIYYMALKNNINVIEVNDKQAKKLILGKGTSTKEDVMNYFKLDNEHEADATLFANYISAINIKHFTERRN
jgi:Holliday junction resolvasome RuvABC endonuclease subunit